MAGARAAWGSRLYFVDYLRAAIVSLVFRHHTAIVCGASGSWYYIEPVTDAAAAGLLSSAFYAVWESTFAVGACMFAVGLFRKHFRKRGRLWSFLLRNSYAAYVMQAPVIVVVGAFLLQPVHLESLLKCMLAAVIAVPSVWLTANLVPRIPGAARIL